MKMVVNAYLATLVEGVAEALELAELLGIDLAAMDDAIEGGPLDAPLADAKLLKIKSGDCTPEFPLEWALLSARLTDLTARELITRSVSEGPPVTVTYELTERGQALMPALDLIAAWARDNLPPGDC